MSSRRASALVPSLIGLVVLAGAAFAVRTATVPDAVEAFGAEPAAGPFAAGSVVAAGDLEVALRRANLEPTALASAGLSANEAAAVVNAVRQHLLAQPTALSSADTSHAAARVASDALERKVATGLASPEEVTALATAKTTLASAVAARTTAVNAIFDAGTTGLSSQKLTVLATIRTNAAAWQGIEVPYLSIERSQADWVALRDAMSAKRIAANEGEQTPQVSASLLSSCDQNETVAAAKAALAANGAEVLSSWNSAIQG